MKLQRGIQKQIRLKTGFGAPYVSDICTGKIRITSWPTAKKFAAATYTDPLLWLEAPTEVIIQTISKKIEIRQTLQIRYCKDFIVNPLTGQKG
ncbi:hypothetical protein KAJ27_03060 [bacterium]|nr:hypothetical protein [bacterium]